MDVVEVREREGRERKKGGSKRSKRVEGRGEKGGGDARLAV